LIPSVRKTPKGGERGFREERYRMTANEEKRERELIEIEIDILVL